MRVVITGGAGFIGANLARALVESGDEVVVVDDLSTGSEANLDGVPVDLRIGSILDPGLLDSAFDGADAVVHLAAVPSVPRSVADPVTSHHANATGTLLVLDAARRQASPPHVTVASSSSVYGANPELPKHEGLRCAPLSPYAVSKLATESYAIAFAHCYGLECLAFRFFNVFGPLQAAGHAYAAVIPQFVSAALDGRPLPLDGDGTQSRDFTYVGFGGAGARRRRPPPGRLRGAGQPGVRRVDDSSRADRVAREPGRPPRRAGAATDATRRRAALPGRPEPVRCASSRASSRSRSSEGLDETVAVVPSVARLMRARGGADDHRPGLARPESRRAGADEGTVSDGQSLQDDCTAADGDVVGQGTEPDTFAPG